MATTAITPDQDTITAEIFIAAPPERVFQAIADPSQTRQWWGDKHMYTVRESSGDLRPGGKWRTAGEGADGKKFHVEGEYLEIDPPRKLVHTWIPSYREGLKTVVHWELEPQPIHNLQSSGPKKAGMGTLLRLRHEGFAGFAAAAADHSQGWKRVLGWMQEFVERGITIETRN